MHKVRLHQKKRNYVSIYRSKIDDNAIHGYILAHSDELLVVQYLYDFNLDGLMVLRVADITEIRCSAADEFKKGLLLQEGLEQKVPFQAIFDLRDWRSLITQFAREYPLLIIEREAGDEKDFFIGRIMKITKTGVQAQFFSGVANWSESFEKLKFKDMTCCKVDSNYINVYQRHFERHAS